MPSHVPCPNEAEVLTQRGAMCADCFNYWQELWGREKGGANPAYRPLALAAGEPCNCGSVAHDERFKSHVVPK